MKWFPIPLRYSIPVILILFSIIFGIYSFQHEMNWSYFVMKAMRSRGQSPSATIFQQC